MKHKPENAITKDTYQTKNAITPYETNNVPNYFITPYLYIGFPNPSPKKRATGIVCFLPFSHEIHRCLRPSKSCFGFKPGGHTSSSSSATRIKARIVG
jgi:hypothetical protein